MGASARRAHVDVAVLSKQDVGTLRFAHPTLAGLAQRQPAAAHANYAGSEEEVGRHF